MEKIYGKTWFMGDDVGVVYRNRECTFRLENFDGRLWQGRIIEGDYKGERVTIASTNFLDINNLQANRKDINKEIDIKPVRKITKISDINPNFSVEEVEKLEKEMEQYKAAQEAKEKVAKLVDMETKEAPETITTHNGANSIAPAAESISADFGEGAKVEANTQSPASHSKRNKRK